MAEAFRWAAREKLPPVIQFLTQMLLGTRAPVFLIQIKPLGSANHRRRAMISAHGGIGEVHGLPWRGRTAKGVASVRTRFDGRPEDARWPARFRPPALFV